MSENETIEGFIQNLPEYFRQLRPHFKPGPSRSLRDFSERQNALGNEPIFELMAKLLVTRYLRLPEAELRTEQEAALKAALRPRQYDPAKLIALARKAKSDARADIIFRLAVADLLGRGELPPELQPYVTRLVISTSTPPRKKRGKSADDNWTRDVFIGRFLEVLVDEGGYRATRNRDSRLLGKARKESACSIVMNALGEAGIHFTEDAVEKIWKAHRRRTQRPSSPTAPE
jgi:hypothetical protein